MGSAKYKGIEIKKKKKKKKNDNGEKDGAN